MSKTKPTWRDKDGNLYTGKEVQETSWGGGILIKAPMVGVTRIKRKTR